MANNKINIKYITTEITIYFAWLSFFLMTVSANIIYAMRTGNSWIVHRVSIFFFIQVILGIVVGCFISRDLNKHNGSIPQGIKVAVKLSIATLFTCLIVLIYIIKTDLTIWR